MGEFSSFVRFVGLFILSVSITLASKDQFEAVLGSSSSCRKSCEMTYSLHTYPRDNELFACKRGCRLFAICQFIRDTDDLNLTKSECESSCSEAHSQSDEQYACKLGCQNQIPFAIQRQEELEEMMPQMQRMQPQGIWEDMMNQAHSFIFASWTFYLQSDDGKVVILSQSEPQIRIYTQIEVENDVKEEPQKSILNSPIYKEYNRNSVQERDRDMSECTYDDNYNIFGCLASNLWLPGWILTTTLIMSVLVLIWICCATVATAVDQYVPAEKLSIYGDNEYLDEKKLIPYPQSSLVIISSKDPEEEAGPLPPKVDLGQSNL